MGTGEKPATGDNGNLSSASGISPAPRSPSSIHAIPSIFIVNRVMAGLRPRLHDLRHTRASALIAGGFDAVAIGRRLGHASPVVTLSV